MSQRERAVALGVAIRAARESAGLTQEDVASRIDLHPMTYGGIERGRLLPSVSTLTRICVLLKIDPDQLPDLQDVRD
ncbi:helix-turn-helix transcriptional regulator [Hyalangium rubrum]|uniref:Helix-turn-helix transcriptional regulator n=1 Tax=Hyalangium rubrum TaxID=3103134 RepID=A0ABU5H5Y9_9BACT|nr:helix-turn-helix transcriptional regulator [Hyalangium sp. s54d21]MDY7228284.1 helix-turn-helix transcriptional regulator [Hyalangium sp. s54d21]